MSLVIQGLSRAKSAVCAYEDLLRTHGRSGGAHGILYDQEFGSLITCLDLGRSTCALW